MVLLRDVMPSFQVTPRLHGPYKKPPQIFGNVQYWVNQVCRCAAWLTDVKKSRTGLETENK